MSSALGDYLRSRRAATSPDTAGVVSRGVRRVPGLRREEVAMLAGVSVDYYVRLEQGRERNPSPQVLDALAATFRLDADGRAHLYRVAGLAPSPVRLPSARRVAPQLLELMEHWPDNPALVYDRANDVLAANALAEALFEEFAFSRNLLEVVFLWDEASRFYPDHDLVAASAVAGFRLAHGEDPDDPRVREVLTTLLEQSPAFTSLWQRNDARGKTLEQKTMVHRDVGPLTLRMQAFDVRSAPGQQLVVYDAPTGSPSHQALRLLGSLAASASHTADAS